MTTLTLSRETQHHAGFASQFGLMGRIKIYLSRSRAERQLHQLDDRMLADIGLPRGEITNSVWGN